MDKRNNRKDKKSLSTNRVAEIDIRKTKTNERMRTDTNLDKNVKTLTELKLELDEAAKINPCPGCKHDTEQLAKFISAKLDYVRNGSNIDREMVNPLRKLTTSNCEIR
jgi:hypothetical protein